MNNRETLQYFFRLVKADMLLGDTNGTVQASVLAVDFMNYIDKKGLRVPYLP